MPPKFKKGSDYFGNKESERAALLDGTSDDEDFFLTGPTANPGKLVRDHAKIGQVQRQVDEVVDVMQDNISKVLDRGERLEDLQDKSESLSMNADEFRMKARSLKSRMWWKECRMRVLIAVVVLIILLIIFVPIIVKSTQGN